MNQKREEWLQQILNQNGFSIEDLAGQTGFAVDVISQAAASEEADSEAWNIILDTVNDYPSIMLPASSIIDDLKNDIQKYGDDALCLVFYGVNQNLLGFVEYQCMDDLQMHGSPVSTEFLSSMQLALSEALELFTKQSYTQQKFGAPVSGLPEEDGNDKTADSAAEKKA